MTNTYKILGQGLTSDLLAPGSTVRKATVYEVPQNTSAAVSAINITNSGDEEVTYDLAFVKDADVSLETENVNVSIYTFAGFVAAQGSSNTGRYSADGVTWQNITFPGSGMNYSRKVAYGNGRFVSMSYDMNGMMGTPNNWSTSTNGIDWTQIPSTNNINPQIIRYVNNKFVALFQSNNIMATSEDGLTWTQVSPQYNDMGMTNSLNALDVAYGNGKYVLIDYMSPAIYYSTDLISWTRQYISGQASPYKSIAYGNNKFVAIGPYGSAYSTDGTTWTGAAVPWPEAGGRSIVFGEGKFVVNGGEGYAYGSVAYSTDGINWTSVQHGSPSFMEIGKIGYGNGIFVVTGSNAPIKTSSDGITWTQVAGTTSMDNFMDVVGGEFTITDSYSIPKTLYKHRIVSRKAILPGETQEIKGGITLSAGDQIRVISSADDIITNVYGVEIS